MDLKTLLPVICLFINSIKGNKFSDCTTPHKREDKAHYYRYSLPGEYFQILEDAPEFNTNTIKDDKLKPFMKKMPIDNANRISIFGHIAAKTRDKDFTVYFGDETTPVFWFRVSNGVIIFENHGGLPELLQLTHSFVLAFEFRRNSVEVNIYEMSSALHRIKFCFPYRTFGVNISHMAIFAKCDGVNLHMVNFEEYPGNSKLCATTREGAENKVVAYDPQKNSVKAKTGRSEFLEPITGYIKDDKITFYHPHVEPMSFADFAKGGTWFTDC